jgi:chorismate mutase
MTHEDAMHRLIECRDKIDEVDIRILELLNRRTSIVEEIGRIKRDLDLPIYEPKREDDVYRNVTSHNRGPLAADAVKRVFERIIDEMRSIQRVRMLQEKEARGRDEAC